MNVKNESSVLIVAKAAVAGSYMNPAKLCNVSKTPSSTYPTTRPWGCAAVGLPMVLALVPAHPGIETNVKTPSFRGKLREVGDRSVARIDVVNSIGDVISEYGTRKNGGCQHERQTNSGVHRRPPFFVCFPGRLHWRSPRRPGPAPMRR